MNCGKFLKQDSEKDGKGAKRKFFLVPNVALTVTLLIEHQGRLFLWQRCLSLLLPLLASSELSLDSQLLQEL